MTNRVIDNIPERFKWAHKCMGIDPQDTILEIGCGAGLFADLIARSLGSGRLVALDKSKAMTTKAHQRLLSFVSTTVELITGDVEKVKGLNLKFDKIVSFNVNLFWKGTTSEFRSVRNLLKVGGVLFVFYDSPKGSTDAIIQKISQKLKDERFDVVEITTTHLSTGSVCCIKATSR